MQKRAARLQSSRIGDKLGCIWIDYRLDLRIGQEALQAVIVSDRNEPMNFIDLGIKEKRLSKLKLLIDVCVLRKINWVLAVVIGQEAFDSIMLKQRANNMRPAKICGKVQRSVSVFIASIDVDARLGQDILHRGQLCALNGEM